jgi:hypothetical protein
MSVVLCASSGRRIRQAFQKPTNEQGNFHEKAHFVKPTWWLYIVVEPNGSVPFALCFHPL